MCKYVLIGLTVFLVLLMVIAAVVVQEYGWTGFLIMLGVMVVLGYAARRLLPRLFGYLLMRPLRRMGEALRGATIVVHSVTPCEPPAPDDYSEDDNPEYIGDDEDDDGFVDDSDDYMDDDADSAEPGPFQWYRVEFTVTPPDGGSCEGRFVTRHAWSPALIGATFGHPGSSRFNPYRGWPPPESFNDSMVQSAEVEIWDGADYVTPSESVFGEQRLRMRVGVTKSVSEATVTYTHLTEIGTIQFPRVDITPE
jgi:hypothetical protein